MENLTRIGDDVTLYHGDCRVVLPTLPDASVDAVVCDPPYPCIKRSYGTWTEEEWFDLIKPVVLECRRVLKPHGSAVFVLQPNQERFGKTRLWLWDFLLWAGREWNLVQDIYWWNFTAIPNAPAIQGGLTRQSLKYCLWFGDPDCHRNQVEVLWQESQRTTALRLATRAGKQKHSRGAPSGYNVNDVRAYAASELRGGVIPFNVLPFDNANPYSSAGTEGHGAGTAEKVCDWWIRYLTRPGDTVLDPFIGSGTTGLAALKLRRKVIGIERDPDYFAISQRRLSGPTMPLFEATDNGMQEKQNLLF